tara:strand:+ start:92 stop:475 length:384 start_codon:yes stop_codon:yes gene_type:complete
MRVLPLIIVAGYSRISNHQSITYKNIYYPIINNNSSSNYMFDTSYFNKKKRTIRMLINKYNNRDINKCYFCYGTGYIPCKKCNQNICIECENTGYKPCNICGGSGRGGPRPFPIKIFPNENENNLVL